MDSFAAGSQARSFKIMAGALAVTTLITALKFAAYLATGSAAILSDALESVINVVAGGFALYSVWLGKKPPDRQHPYGHGKIEFFAVGFEGALIVVAAAAILYRAVPAFFTHAAISRIDAGIGLILAATAANFVLAFILIRTGRRGRSPALEADGRHLLTDVFTSLGVVCGLILVRFTGATWVDPAVACLVGVHVLVSGYGLLRQSFGSLMDEADPRFLQQVIDLLNQHRECDWIDLHQLRARRYGPRVAIDLHLILPRPYTLDKAHAQAQRVEEIIRRAFQEVAEVTVHVDPCEDPLCPQCCQEECSERTAAGAADPGGFNLAEAVVKREHDR